MNEIVSGTYWVGVPVPPAGTSLNAFLILDEKTALIDTGSIGTRDAMLENIKRVADPSIINYIILTHNCIDHCGGLAPVLEAAKNAKVVASELTALRLPLVYGIRPEVMVVKDGDTLELGRRKLKFIYAPYLCKPDSMFVYDATDRILFTADAFGIYTQPNAEWRLFAEGDIIQALKSYSRINFGEQSNLANAIKKIEGLEIDIIAPGHGPMLRGEINRYIEALSQ
jgi:flavorubredoxin